MGYGKKGKQQRRADSATRGRKDYLQNKSSKKKMRESEEKINNLVDKLWKRVEVR